MPQFVQLLQDHSQADVQVERGRRFAEASFVRVAGPTAHGGHGFGQRILDMARGIMGHLQVERFAGLHLASHEVQAAFGHAVQLFRVRMSYVFRPAILGRAVAFVETVLGRIGPADVPLAEMGSRVTGPLQQFRNGRFAQRQFHRAGRRNHSAVRTSATVALTLGDERHVQLCRALAGEERRPRRRTARRGCVEVGQPHAFAGQSLEVGCAQEAALRVWHGVIHLHRRAGPTLAFAENEHEVGLRRSRVIRGGGRT